MQRKPYKIGIQFIITKHKTVFGTIIDHEQKSFAGSTKPVHFRYHVVTFQFCIFYFGGGPSGGCIPIEHYDIPIDYDNLIEIGSMMGSGGLIVMDEGNCMVDIAKFFLEFTVEESCGKCVPCRIGTKRLLEILDKITMGKATLEDLDKMEELCDHIKGNSLCGLGQTAPNPVLSTLRYFRDEYVAHVVDKRCPAGVCKNLIRYEIIPDKCTGCTACARNCPVAAINGEVKKVHEIDQEICIKCGVCYDTCRFDAINIV